MYRIEFFGKSDIGLIRSNNEDTYLFNSQAGFCLVADGMGGAAAGETASRIFAQSAAAVYCDRMPSGEQEAIKWVHNVFMRANTDILQYVVEFPENKGMGCTAELLSITETGFVIGHMGDSRTYRLRQGILKQLTKDHSLVQEQIDKGLITPKQARTHTMRNIILRAVGVRKVPILDTLRGPIFPGDLFLLCSDGLTDLVEDAVIEKGLMSSSSLAQKAEYLVALANKTGGKDNITVVLAHVR